jgi:MOSC domain-containing protein YiiM
MSARIVGLSRDSAHRLAKRPCQQMRLIAGHGVQGDAHCGTQVQHLSRVARDPAAPNLRQVHLIHGELLDELAGKGFPIEPGQLGENILTWGIDLLGLSRGTRLRLGPEAVIEVTGLRNPCHQLNGISPSLMQAVLDRAADGSLIRKCGVMAVVVIGGEVQTGAEIVVIQTPVQQVPLTPV